MAFQAYASKHGSVVKDTAYTAAVAFFEEFPKARKCNVIEGKDDGFFFTVEYKPNNRSPKYVKLSCGFNELVITYISCIMYLLAQKHKK